MHTGLPECYYWFLGKSLDGYGEPAYRISNIYNDVRDLRRALLYDIVKDNTKSGIQVINVFPDRINYDILPANDNIDAYNNTTGTGKYMDNKLVVIARSIQGYIVMDFNGKTMIIDKDSMFGVYKERDCFANVYVYRRGDGRVVVSPKKGERILNIASGNTRNKSKLYKASVDVNNSINKVAKYRNDGLLSFKEESILDRNERGLYKRLNEIRHREQQYDENDMRAPDLGIFTKEVRQLTNIEVRVETQEVYTCLKSTIQVYKDTEKQISRSNGSLDRLMLRIGKEIKNLKREASREDISDAEILIRLKSIRHTLGEIKTRYSGQQYKV